MNIRSRNRGFSLLELVVVIVIIGILLAVALSRLLPYIDEAERVGVLTLEGQIKSTLVTDAAKRIAGGRAASISELDGSNPMRLMLEPPKNYIGEKREHQRNGVPRRSWYSTSRRNDSCIGSVGDLAGPMKILWQTLNSRFALLLMTAMATAASSREPTNCTAYGCKQSLAANGSLEQRPQGNDCDFSITYGDKFT